MSPETSFGECFGIMAWMAFCYGPSNLCVPGVRVWVQGSKKNSSPRGPVDNHFCLSFSTILSSPPSYLLPLQFCWCFIFFFSFLFTYLLCFFSFWISLKVLDQLVRHITSFEPQSLHQTFKDQWRTMVADVKLWICCVSHWNSSPDNPAVENNSSQKQRSLLRGTTDMSPPHGWDLQ